MNTNRSLTGLNGINVVRLILVLLVVLSHSYTLGRFGPSPDWLGQTPGRWALAGLFALSGFLVATGAQKRPIGQFLWTRVARLWPAFMACLLVIALLFAPAGYFIQTGGLDGYLTAEGGPLRFLTLNVMFEMRQTTISGTPDRYGWAGNLWTLVYTVASYVFLALILHRARGSFAIALITVAWICACIVHANMEFLSSYLQSGQAAAFFRFLPYFLGGALVGLMKYRLRFSLVPGLLAFIAAIVVSALFPSWGTQAASPLFAYGLVSIGLSFVAPSLLRENDYSLGFFMYSFAVQKLLRLVGVNELLGDPLLFFVASVAATTPFAIASWHLVEKPLIKARRGDYRQSGQPVGSQPARDSSPQS